VKGRNAQANQIRGLFSEFGLIVPQGIGYLASRVPELIEVASNELPGSFRMLIKGLLDHPKALDDQVVELETQIVKWHRQSAASNKLAQVPGFCPITTSALVASLGVLRTLTVVVRLPHGWAWCPNSTRVAANKSLWASANAAIPICEPYWFTVRVQ
jgi:transposase